jgi:glycosyltransferase involved in cell wall biosynthesis
VVGVPIRIGGGTRLKVIEGLALGKAIVSTSAGCEGIAVRDGEHVLIGDGAHAFASRILELFDDPDVGVRLGRAGRQLAERDYSWQAAGERMERLYQSVVGGGRRAPGSLPRGSRKALPNASG